MPVPPAPPELGTPLRQLVGHLTFSDAAPNAATLAAWNEIYRVAIDGDPLSGLPAWLIVEGWIGETLADLRREGGAFASTGRVERVVKLVWSDLLPAYLDQHRDLLFHQEPELLFTGYFIARAAGAVVGLIDDDDDDRRVVEQAIDAIDDYVGYRPVATLENHDGQPYRNEFVATVPLWVADAGISAGPYERLMALTLEALRDADADILRAASFDPDRMAELSLDPRAYDFDHPVNRRPNHHFGGWDPRRIDGDGYYTRFVVRDATLECLLSRVNESRLDADEVLVEAASVLAGTILMASGVSGWGPGAYTSDVTLASLMRPIARYRDAFYNDRLQKIGGDHGNRLREESRRRHQPFGGARQHLNAALARRRAAQLQHVQLARLYARMGYPEAAKKEADAVSATSARMLCRIDCLITGGLRGLKRGDLAAASAIPMQAGELILRGIECGAFIDPRDILGFGGNYPLSDSPDAAVADTRIDDLLYLIEQVFGYIARVWSEAAARDDRETYDRMETEYRDMAEWWRGYAIHTVASVDATDPLESYDSARLVAQALRYWHRGGAESGDVRFWAKHAEWFDSPRAYALVISALLERGDFVASMALLIHWTGQAERVGLRSGGSSLPRLCERWLVRLRGGDATGPEAWGSAVRFFDYLEANAEEFWSVPTFDIGSETSRNDDSPRWEALIDEADGSEDDGDEGLYDAAYENVTYQDSTDDGNDSSLFDTGDDTSRDALETESKRLFEHLAFLQSLCRMWAVGADMAFAAATAADEGGPTADDVVRSLRPLADRAAQNRLDLLDLIDVVRNYRVEPAGPDKDSMRSYDRLRVMRDALLERVINTAIEMADARRLILAAIWAVDPPARRDPDDDRVPALPTSDPTGNDPTMGQSDAAAVELLGALMAGDSDRIRGEFPAFVDATLPRSLLYIPLSRGGDPVKIFAARMRQRLFQHLLDWLPRRGLIAESCRLVEVARQMEQDNPIGVGAVTEFDGMFRTGFQSAVGALVDSVTGPADHDINNPDVVDVMIPMLERLTEVMLASWLTHSQTLRLSPLESVAKPGRWERLVAFIEEYGDPVFTQAFLQLGNVRAILHQGVFDWLKRIVDEDDAALADSRLVADLNEGRLSLAEAERWVTLVYESMIEHHAEYVDYNSTTTQSDRGELIHTLLDFLRLRVRYERIAWNLRPVMWAHEVLVRRGADAAAMAWRRSLAERIGREAEIYLEKLRELQDRYAMTMPTVADRIAERFIRPMTIDRIRALVAPAMSDAENPEAGSTAFELLQEEADLLTRNPGGVGLDVPAWLNELEMEVEQIAKAKIGSEIDPAKLMTIPTTPLPPERWDDELAAARRQGRGLPHMDD